MATQGDYLVNNTVNDVNSMLQLLEQVGSTVSRVTERMESLGVSALVGYEWPNGYSQADFVNLYQALDALPEMILTDDVRNSLYKLVSIFQ